MTILSGVSSLSEMWEQGNTTHISGNQSSSVPYALSQASGKQNTVINTISLGSSATPTQIAFDPANGFLYVTDYGTGAISVINSTTSSIVGNINLGSSSQPSVIAYDPANNYIYAGASQTDNLSIINATTDTVVENISISLGFSGLVYDPVNTYMYVSNSGNTFSAINSTSNAFVIKNEIVSGTITGMTFDASNSYIYLAFYSGQIQSINSTTNVVGKSVINVGSSPEGMAYDPSNGYLFVDNTGSNTVSMINTTTAKILANATVGSTPSTIVNFEGVAIDPTGNYLYVSNTGSNSVTVINATTNLVVRNLNVGINPEGLVYDSANHYTYVVNHASNNVTVIAPMNTYKATFTESGLPSGTNWYVNLTGQESSGPISGDSYSLILLNGSYSYTISSSSSYAPAHSFGIFAVNGAPPSLSVSFFRAYQVTFTESGLQAFPNWYVGIAGQQSSGTISSGSNYTVDLPNGTYSYNISSTSTSFLNPKNGTFQVNGHSVVESVNFVEVYYVGFFSNLPAEIPWYVNLSNGQSGTSGPGIDVPVGYSPDMPQSMVSLELPNGTYSYTISTADKNYQPVNVSSGITASPVGTKLQPSSTHSFTVDGSNVQETVNFSYAYNITFTESGLASGAAWYVNLSNGQSYTSATNTMSFYEPNGTYSYTISTADKTYSTSDNSGTFTVNNSSVSKTVSFNQVLSKVTFTESGLLSGTVWYVNASGISEHASSQDMVLNLANGTYSFTVSNLSSYYTTTSHISVTVNGKSVTESVQYEHWAYISGTVSPGNATLTVNGKAVAVSSNGSFNVSVANGTYDVVASDTGYHSYSTNITLSNGGAKNLVIDLKPLAKGSSISPDIIYGAIGGVVVVAIGIAFFTIKRK